MPDLALLLPEPASTSAAGMRSLDGSVYSELMRLARAQLGRSGTLSLDAPSLVHEAYLRFAKQGAIESAQRKVFFAYASRVMRTVVVDYVRERHAQKRGGGMAMITLTTGVEGIVFDEGSISHLHDALESLGKIDERSHLVVEMRYFGGMTEEEIADLLEISVPTVKRDWAQGTCFPVRRDRKTTLMKIPAFHRNRWREAYDLFAQWLELNDSRRSALLERIRNDRPQAHQRLVALIHADNDAARLHFMAAGAIADAAVPDSEPVAGIDGSGRRIGNWQLERSLGAGGMGQVWLAHRCDGLHQGHAAIKMLRMVVADARANDRFAQEGRILAQLVHPNIAMLLDAGFTTDGQRYLVLEHVPGERIDRCCDERRLDLPARLRLFLQVCSAVSYAHSNLIVHRDLKPSNILVLEDGTAKLLDFGIAKLIESGADTTAALTGEAGAVMTPGYAAPEQIGGQAITTATDVYALGVILYGLLSGVGPYGQGTLTPMQLARAVIETEPRRLSDVFAGSGMEDIAAARKTSSERLRRSLRGDLDVIVAKALKKNPAERYVSVQALAEDIRRHLDHRPIGARADSRIYYLRKFVRRHRMGVAVSFAIVLIMAISAAALVWESRQTAREARATAVVKDFLFGLFTAVDPNLAKGKEISARELLDRGARQIDADCRERPPC